MYPASAIANRFLEIAKEHGETLTPLKLIKLVYFAYGWYLALTDKHLITEPVVAWQYGPVINSLYQEFKRFGNEPITDYAKIGHTYTENLKEDDVVFALLDKIWEVYGKYSAIQLSNLTHEGGSPWDKTWHEQGASNSYNYPIDDKLIKDYFLEKFQEK